MIRTNRMLNRVGQAILANFRFRLIGRCPLILALFCFDCVAHSCLISSRFHAFARFFWLPSRFAPFAMAASQTHCLAAALQRRIGCLRSGWSRAVVTSLSIHCSFSLLFVPLIYMHSPAVWRHCVLLLCSVWRTKRRPTCNCNSSALLYQFFAANTQFKLNLSLSLFFIYSPSSSSSSSALDASSFDLPRVQFFFCFFVRLSFIRQVGSFTLPVTLLFCQVLLVFDPFFFTWQRFDRKNFSY